LVSDTGNHRVQELTAQGKFVRAFDTNASGLPSPIAVTVDACDKMSASNSCKVICGLQSDGSSVACVEETDGVKFQSVYSLCVTPNDDIAVTDHGNHRVVLLRSDGTFIRAFSSLAGANLLYYPALVACDADGNLFIIDSNASIHAFRSDGSFVHSFRDLKLTNPRGITVLLDGSLAICDSGAKNVQIWK